MNSTPAVSTISNAVFGLGYFYLASKFSVLKNFTTKNQIGAFCVSAIAQAIFQLRNELNVKEKSSAEKIIRYSLPYVLIGVANAYTNRTALKIATISSVLLGTAQLIIGKLSSDYVDNRINSSKFGAEDWQRHYGDVGEIPALPEDLESILDQPCPFWPDKKVRDTHMLTLIPDTVNGEKFTLNKLSELIKSPLKGYRSEFSSSYDATIKGELGDSPVNKSYWVLMTKKTVRTSVSKDYLEQEGILKEKGYDVPTALEVSTCVLTHFVRRKDALYKQTKTHQYLLYPQYIETYFTSFKEKTNLSIGNLIDDDHEGLCLCH